MAKANIGVICWDDIIPKVQSYGLTVKRFDGLRYFAEQLNEEIHNLPDFYLMGPKLGENGLLRVVCNLYEERGIPLGIQSSYHQKYSSIPEDFSFPYIFQTGSDSKIGNLAGILVQRCGKEYDEFEFNLDKFLTHVKNRILLRERMLDISEQNRRLGLSRPVKIISRPEN